MFQFIYFLFFVQYREEVLFTILVDVLVHQQNHVHEYDWIRHDDVLHEIHESLQYVNVLHDVYVPMSDVAYDELKL